MTLKSDDRDLRFGLRARCRCGAHADEAAHEASATGTGYEALVGSAVVRALVPDAVRRRALLKGVGAATVLAAVGQFFPLRFAANAFAEAAKPEKPKLKIGFIPITCATPIIMGKPLGFYEKQGLDVDVVVADLSGLRWDDGLRVPHRAVLRPR